MSDIVRRNESVPVQARRVGQVVPATEPGTEAIGVPSMPPAVPTAAAGSTQNVVYIVNPPAPTLPHEPPAAPQPEVHVHNHTYAPIKRTPNRGTSFLGALAAVVGIAACVAAYQPQVVAYAKPIAEVGLVVGALAWLGATLFRRVGRGLPTLGLITSAAGYGLALVYAGQAPGASSVWDRVRSASPVPLPKFDAVAPPGTPLQPTAVQPGASSGQPVVKPAAAAPSGVVPAQPRSRSIFDKDSPGWQKPSDVQVPAPTPASPTATDVVPAPPLIAPAPTLDPATAQANLESARIAAAQRMGVDYAGAKAAAATAETAYLKEKQHDAPGDADLIVASQRHMTAAADLAQVATRLRADPQVAAAEQALRAARRR